MTHIKGVILDWAGTAVDFGCIAPAKVFVDIFNRKGVEISMEQVRKPMGLAKRDHIKTLLEMPEIHQQWVDKYGETPNETDINEIYTESGAAMVEILKDYATPIPGTVDFMQAMKKSGIKVGSTTGYVSEMMRDLIPQAAKQGFTPDSIVTSSDVPMGRPHPYMCYLNAIKMGVYPFRQMVKIGDTVADVKEGLNAGMWTIGLTKSGNEIGLSLEEIEQCEPSVLKKKLEAATEKLFQAGAHYVVESIAECLPVLEDISSRIERGESPYNAR